MARDRLKAEKRSHESGPHGSNPTKAGGQTAVGAVATFGTAPLQVMFFGFTFVAIGIATRFSNLNQVSIGKPVVTYVLTLLFATVWGGILAGWLLPA